MLENEMNDDAKPIKTNENKQKKTDTRPLAILVVGIANAIGGLVCIIVAMLYSPPEHTPIEYPTIPSYTPVNNNYSSLTGEILPENVEKNSPTFCIQTPNGTDGARPQAGLTEAGVIFEAIAEAGITRFAAIYQQPSSAVIGPIRSLRLYYLDWDTPFDCTIVHAGGADDALMAVASGGYKDLSENYSYMYRGTYQKRLWNNLFTSSSALRSFTDSHGYYSSDIHSFARMTPEESNKDRVDSLVKTRLDITSPTSDNTSELSPDVMNVNLRFGGVPTFNVNYTYDLENNRYLRKYENGVPHEVYKCPAEDLSGKNPEDICELIQMAPSVVIAMVVNERRAADNYHEVITTTGSGKAYIFQNGKAISGTWSKTTRNDQIEFLDEEGKQVKLAPGQTFISAIPSYGSIEY
jgi:hypothetical protein